METEQKEKTTLLRDEDGEPIKWKGDIHPELMSDQPTHTFRGVKVKVYSHINMVHNFSVVEIMEGADKGKLTNAFNGELEEIQKCAHPKCDNKVQGQMYCDEKHGGVIAGI